MVRLCLLFQFPKMRLEGLYLTLEFLDRLVHLRDCGVRFLLQVIAQVCDICGQMLHVFVGVSRSFRKFISTRLGSRGVILLGSGRSFALVIGQARCRTAIISNPCSFSDRITSSHTHPCWEEPSPYRRPGWKGPPDRRNRRKRCCTIRTLPCRRNATMRNGKL